MRLINEYLMNMILEYPGYEDDWDTWLTKQNPDSDWRKEQQERRFNLYCIR